MENKSIALASALNTLSFLSSEHALALEPSQREAFLGDVRRDVLVLVSLAEELGRVWQEPGSEAARMVVARGLLQELIQLCDESASDRFEKVRDCAKQLLVAIGLA